MVEPADIVERLKAGMVRRPVNGVTDAGVMDPNATAAIMLEAAERITSLMGERDARDELLGRAAVNMPQGAREVEFLPENIMFLRRRAEAAEAQLSAMREAVHGLREGNDMLHNEPALFVAGYERAVEDAASALRRAALQPPQPPAKTG